MVNLKFYLYDDFLDFCWAVDAELGHVAVLGIEDGEVAWFKGEV